MTQQSSAPAVAPTVLDEARRYREQGGYRAELVDYLHRCGVETGQAEHLADRFDLELGLAGHRRPHDINPVVARQLDAHWELLASTADVPAPESADTQPTVSAADIVREAALRHATGTADLGHPSSLNDALGGPVPPTIEALLATGTTPARTESEVPPLLAAELAAPPITAVAESAIAEPSIAEPSIAEPSIAEPSVAETVDADYPVTQPTASEAGTPHIAAAPIEFQAVATPLATAPDAVAPPATPEQTPPAPDPIAPQPATPQPMAAQPIAPQPIPLQPATPQPAAPQPIAARPIAPQPGASHPVAPPPALPSMPSNDTPPGPEQPVSLALEPTFTAPPATSPQAAPAPLPPLAAPDASPLPAPAAAAAASPHRPVGNALSLSHAMAKSAATESPDAPMASKADISTPPRPDDKTLDDDWQETTEFGYRIAQSWDEDDPNIAINEASSLAREGKTQEQIIDYLLSCHVSEDEAKYVAQMTGARSVPRAKKNDKGDRSARTRPAKSGRIKAIIALTSIAGALLMYQGWSAWNEGLDSSRSPLSLVAVGAALLLGGMWVSVRRR